MNESDFTHWLELPEGSRHVAFGDLPHLIAKALWPDSGDEESTNWSYGGARVNLEEELPRAVHEGRLAVKNPLSLGPHSFPHGDALNNAVVLLPDLRAFLAQRGIGVRVGPGAEPATYPVEAVAREAATLRHPIDADADDDARILAEAWQHWTTETLLIQLNGYVYDRKASVQFDGKTVSGPHASSNVPKDQWRVNDAGRKALIALFMNDGATVWATFSVPPRPTAVPQVLRLLASDTRVRLQWSWQRLSERTCTAADAIEEFTDTIARQSQGWLRIDEAAEVLNDAGRGASASWRGKFMAAAEAGTLPAHEPGTLDRVVYKPLTPAQQPRQARDYFELVHVDDLDNWLRTNEPRLAPFLFASTSLPQAVKAGPNKPVPRERAHEDAILAKVVELGFNPAAIPRPPSGKKSAAKQGVKAALGLSNDVMNKAWQRLRSSGRIKDA